MSKVIGKIIYVGSLVIGGLIALFSESYGLGMGILFIGGLLGVGIQGMGDDYSSSYTTSSSKKPYYKDEFEEYQHYKFVNKHMKK